MVDRKRPTSAARTATYAKTRTHLGNSRTSLHLPRTTLPSSRTTFRPMRTHPSIPRTPFQRSRTSFPSLQTPLQIPRTSLSNLRTTPHFSLTTLPFPRTSLKSTPNYAPSTQPTNQTETSCRLKSTPNYAPSTHPTPPSPTPACETTEASAAHAVSIGRCRRSRSIRGGLASGGSCLRRGAGVHRQCGKMMHVVKSAGAIG